MADAQEKEMNQEEQDALLDALLKGCSNPKEILGKHGLLDQLTKRLGFQFKVIYLAMELKNSKSLDCLL